MIPLRRIDSEIIHFGRTNHQPDNAVGDAHQLGLVNLFEVQWE